MTGFYRSATGNLRGILDEISRLLDQIDLWSDEAATALGRVHEALELELRVKGAVELRVRGNGALSINGVPVAAQRGGSLGRVLAAVGVRELVFLPGLELEHLTRFLQIVGLIGSSPSGSESDLVTFWVEEGAETVRIGATDLEASHLQERPPRALPELAAVCALFAPLDERTRLVRDWPRTTGLLVSGTVEPCEAAARELDGAQHAAIDTLLAPLRGEDEASLRRQLLATLMAATSVHVPALQPREYAFLAGRVAGEQMLEGAWDDLTKTIRNFEFLLDPATAVSEHTRSAARLCLERLHSPAMLVRLVAASDGEPPPFRLVRWFIGESPLPLWRDSATQIGLEDLEGLVALFSICFAFEHPFWNEAVEVLDGERATIVRNVIASLETRWLDDYDASPAAVSRRSDLGGDSAVGWDDFDLDMLEESDSNELDASLIAFLDASDSSLGPTRGRGVRLDPNAVPRSMVEQLDELERSLGGSPPPRGARRGGGGSR